METIRQQSFIRSNMLFVSNKLRFGADDVVCDVPSQIITSYTKGDKKAFASVSDKIKVCMAYSEVLKHKRRKQGARGGSRFLV